MKPSVKHISTFGGRIKAVFNYLKTDNEEGILTRMRNIPPSDEIILGRYLEYSEFDCKPLRWIYKSSKLIGDVCSITSPTYVLESFMPLPIRQFLREIRIWKLLENIHPLLTPVLRVSSILGDIFKAYDIVVILISILLAMSIDFNRWKDEGYPLPPLETRYVAIATITTFLELSEVKG